LQFYYQLIVYICRYRDNIFIVFGTNFVLIAL